MSENKDWTDGLNKALGADFSSDDIVEKIEHEKNEFETKKNSIVERATAGSLTLRDAEYIRLEIHELLVQSKEVMDNLAETLKVGAPPRAYEVYSTLFNSRIAGLRELKALSKTELDINAINNKSNGVVNNTLVMMMDHNQLAKMAKKIESQNSLNDINTDFNISEDDLK